MIVAVSAIGVILGALLLLAYLVRRRAIEVRGQQALLQALVDNMPMGVIARTMKAPDRGRIIVWNPAVEFIFGVPATEALGKLIGDVLTPEYAAGVEERDRALLESPMVQDLPRVMAQVQNLGPRVLRVTRAPIFDRHEQVEYILAIIQDVTTEQANADALRLHAKVFETTADAIVISDADDRVIAVNAAFSKLTGFAPEDMLGIPLVESPFGPSDRAGYAARLETLIKEGCVTSEVLRYRKDGSSLPCWLTKTYVRDGEGAITNFVRIFTDISKLKAAQTKLERLANVDVLTGLLNRRVFHDRLEQALKRAERAGRLVGLLFIDLDGFKKINDAHGHDAGDAALREVARRLQRCVRGGDSLCRLGGDEFTVIMENATLPMDSYAIGERIACALDAPMDIAGQVVRCWASIGIALYPQHGGNAETLLKRADMAMYRAKHEGRQRCVVAIAEDSISPLENAIG